MFIDYMMENHYEKLKSVYIKNKENTDDVEKKDEIENNEIVTKEKNIEILSEEELKIKIKNQISLTDEMTENIIKIDVHLYDSKFFSLKLSKKLNIYIFYQFIKFISKVDQNFSIFLKDLDFEIKDEISDLNIGDFNIKSVEQSLID
jgi:hypothetical protein